MLRRKKNGLFKASYETFFWRVLVNTHQNDMCLKTYKNVGNPSNDYFYKIASFSLLPYKKSRFLLWK